MKCHCRLKALVVGIRLKGNPHQILHSEMSLPGIEVRIEEVLPKILGTLGKENPLKDDAKLPLYGYNYSSKN